MTQHELNLAVARATDETIATVARMGFVPLAIEPSEREPFAVHWDAPDAGQGGCRLRRRRIAAGAN